MKNTIRTIVFGMAAMSFLRYAIAKDIIVVVPAHPDDLIPCFGTCPLSKDIFEWHVIEFTHGERGMGEQGYRDGSTKKIRMAEEGAVCKELAAAEGTRRPAFPGRKTVTRHGKEKE